MDRSPPRKITSENIKEIFSRLYADYANRLYAYGLSFGIAPETAKDAIQDVFAGLYGGGKLKDIRNLKAYLFQSFRNRVVTLANRDKRIDHYEDPENMAFKLEISFVENMISAEEQEIICKRVLKLLKHLTHRQKEAIYLRFIEELSYDEIASLLGMNSASARKLIYRSMEKLRQHAASDPSLKV